MISTGSELRRVSSYRHCLTALSRGGNQQRVALEHLDIAQFACLADGRPQTNHAVNMFFPSFLGINRLHVMGQLTRPEHGGDLDAGAFALVDSSLFRRSRRASGQNEHRNRPAALDRTQAWTPESTVQFPPPRNQFTVTVQVRLGAFALPPGWMFD